MAQDIAYKNFEQPSNQEEQAKQPAKKPTNLTFEGYWKTKLAKIKEEMQKKGRIKMAKRKNKNIDVLYGIFGKLESNLCKEEIGFLKSCIRKSFLTKRKIEE